VVTPSTSEVAAVVVNDPALAARAHKAFANALGEDAVVSLRQRPGEDTLAAYVPASGEPMPTLLVCLGVSDPAKVAESRRTGVPLPSTHSPKYAPVVDVSLRTGIAAMAAAAKDLMPR